MIFAQIKFSVGQRCLWKFKGKTGMGKIIDKICKIVRVRDPNEWSFKDDPEYIVVICPEKKRFRVWQSELKLLV